LKATLILIYFLVLQVVALRNEALTAIEIMQPVTTIAITTRFFGLPRWACGIYSL